MDISKKRPDFSTSRNESEPIQIESAKDEIVKEKKLSMLSKPNRVRACVPDLSAPEETLIAMGLEKGDDGWHVNNRDWFPNPLNEDSVIIDYGVKEDGSRDLGFCSKAEFAAIYAHTEEYDKGKIEYIDPQNLTKGQFTEATKCATGEFVLVPEGTKVKTNEGEVVVTPGQILIINENKNSIFVTDIVEVLKRYIADSMNPASKEAFQLLEEFQKTRAGAKPEELKDIFVRLIEKFNALDRAKKRYQRYDEPTEEMPIETLQEQFTHAAEIVKELDKEISAKIDSLKFDERIEQARLLIQEILASETLTTEQKDVKLAYIKARLLPKTNNHQHLKGSVPRETLLQRARLHGFDESRTAEIENAYQNGADGFANLDEFNHAYGTIASAIRTPDDYRAAVHGIIEEAVRSGQLAVEIRCSVIGQKDKDGNNLNPREATENLIKAMEEACIKLGEDAPKTGFTFLGYRGRDWKPEEVIEHAKLAVEFARKYPNKKFSFDIAGPEDTGYNPSYFQEAFKIIKQHNNDIKSGEIKGELIGITIHAGETPTYNQGLSGNKAIEEALDMGADRIGHSVQAVTDPNTLNRLRESGATVEICGVCNISSIPLNTRGMAIHPIQEFIRRDIPITICTDNDAICGTNITKEYAQFLLTGHSELMNWNTVKEAARNGIETAFISEKDRAEALRIFKKRIRIIERMIVEEKTRSAKETDQKKIEELRSSIAQK